MKHILRKPTSSSSVSTALCVLLLGGLVSGCWTTEEDFATAGLQVGPTITPYEDKERKRKQRYLNETCYTSNATYNDRTVAFEKLLKSNSAEYATGGGGGGGGSGGENPCN
jgi:hypothetical protein